MSYPPYLARITHFAFDSNAGIDAPSPVGVDSEINAIHTSVNLQNAVLRQITTADGRLKNVGATLAMSLAGFDEITATAAQTDFVTTIDWDAAMSVNSTLVFVNNVRVDLVSVQDDGNGFLEVTLAAQDVGNTVSIYAFSGATALLASNITIADAGSYTAQTNVEEAIQELFSHTQGASGKSWLEGVLVMSDYLLLAGGTMTGDITFSASKTVKGLRASAANGEAVRHEQIVAVQSSLSGLTSTFMPKSGGTWSGPLNYNSQVTTGVPTPTTSDAIASKGYVDTTLASFGGLPVGTLIDYAAASPPTGWLLCDGSAINRTTYASLFAVIGVTWGVGDGSTTFNVPDFRGRMTIGAGTGSGLTTRALAATGGEESHILTEGELPSHYHFMFSVTAVASGHAQTTAATNVTVHANNNGDDSYQAIQPAALETPTVGRTGTVGSGTAVTQMSPFAVATKIIKY